VTTLRHWLKFNTVGFLGMGVQLVSLTALKAGMGVNYLTATLLAVETAILHNFIWHERWVWVDRTRYRSDGVLFRLMRFNMANGLISLMGNLLLMWLFVEKVHLHYLFANIIAIGMCATINFVVSDRLIFPL
jgi:putative flippase GtrA